MTLAEPPAQFNWTLLQRGNSPLQPDGTVDTSGEHCCSTVLVWPAGQLPRTDNTLMIDPCFTDSGYDDAVATLGDLDATMDDIGHIFVTHLHPDHMLHLPYTAAAPRFRPFRPNTRPVVFARIEATHCPGHHPGQQALSFTDVNGESIWVAGDAVLGAAWLRDWAYYWPNGYTPGQIVETWRSVARIIAQADVIVPGHDAPLRVTAALVDDLLTSFPKAEYASQCSDVPLALRTRLEQLAQQDQHR